MIYVANMTTEHFAFQALGASPKLAREALYRGWKKHLQQLKGKNLMTICGLRDYYGISVTALEMNDCARDFEALGVA